ncbi:MAG: hypothetical protein KGZ72_11960 [Roseovarius sp.]|jgi:hypothetical protein|nr:hypothetical protein [Roseovarius sp.]
MATYPSRTSFTAQKQDSADKWILGLAFVVGIVGSLALKIYGFPLWMPAVFAGGIIILYALLAHLIPTIQLESDQVGDNAYYLGFVLTLTSLSFTLYELGQHGSDADFIAYVIAGFGVALSSTIVGVAVRVICLQFRLDLVARDREARLALNDAMRRFRAEMTDVIRGTKYLGVEIRQSLIEYHEELAVSHRRSTESLNVDLIKAFRESLEPLNNQLSDLMRQIMSDAQSASKASGDARDASLKATTVSLASATQEISKELSNVISTVKGTLSEGVVNFKAASEAISEQVAQTGQILERQRTVSDSLIKEASKSATTSVNLVASSASDTVGNMAQRSSESIDSATKGSLQSLEMFRSATQGIVAALQKQTDELTALQLSLKKSELQASSFSDALLLQMRGLSDNLIRSQELQVAALERILDQQKALATRTASMQPAVE